MMYCGWGRQPTARGPNAVRQGILLGARGKAFYLAAKAFYTLLPSGPRPFFFSIKDMQ